MWFRALLKSHFYLRFPSYGPEILSYICLETVVSRDWASLVAQRWRTCLPMQETQIPFLVWEDPLEEDMATHSNILAWKIPGTEEPGGLLSIRLQRVRHDWAWSHLQRLQDKIFSWPKISFGFFCNILRKNSNKLFWPTQYITTRNAPVNTLKINSLCFPMNL